MAHKKLPHKTLRVHSARYTQCIHVGSHKLKLPQLQRERQTDRQTDRDTERDRERDRDRERQKQRDKERERQKEEGGRETDIPRESCFSSEISFSAELTKTDSCHR